MRQFTGERLRRVMASPQYRDGRFHNPSGLTSATSGNMFGLLREFAFGGASRRPPAPIPLFDPRAAWQSPPQTGWRVTWLGHSALLLELEGKRLLLDPMFDDRASPAPAFGTRFHKPPVTIAQMPPLDLVILSHDHYDHLGARTMREIAARGTPILTSLGVGARLERMGVSAANIIELDWWETFELPASNVSITATPAQHFSGRGAFDGNRTLWSSFVIQGASRRMFFSADTGLTDELRTIAERFGPFDLTMLEIGASDPRWEHIHLGPAYALDALALMGGGPLLPIHWATFDLGLHPWSEPAETLVRLADTTGVNVQTPRIGQPFEPLRDVMNERWWRAMGVPAP